MHPMFEDFCGCMAIGVRLNPKFGKSRGNFEKCGQKLGVGVK